MKHSALLTVFAPTLDVRPLYVVALSPMLDASLS